MALLFFVQGPELSLWHINIFERYRHNLKKKKGERGSQQYANKTTVYKY